MDKVFSLYVLFYIGHFLKRIQLLDKLSKRINHFFIYIIALFGLIIAEHFGKINLGGNEYVNPVFMLVVSLLGWIAVYETANCISKIKLLGKTLAYVGHNSISILILHFLAFKVVNLIGVVIKKMPLFTVAGFPVTFSYGLWWIAYMIIGIGLPLLCWSIFRHFQEKVLGVKLKCGIGRN